MDPLLFAVAVGLPAVVAALLILLILRWRATGAESAQASAPPADLTPPAPVRMLTPAPVRASALPALNQREMPPAAEWRAWLWTYATDGATSPILPALPAPPATSDTAVTAPAASTPDASTPAAAVAPEPPSIAPAEPAAPPGMDERALAILTQVYREAIQITYDQSLPALCISFTACPVRTPDQVTLAFSTLYTKTRLLLGGESSRSALLLDVTGLEVGPSVQAEWDAAFETFLAHVCAEGLPGAYLLARFAAPLAALAATLPRMPTPALVRAAPGAFADINLSPSAVFHSRDEAVRYLADLRHRLHPAD